MTRTTPFLLITLQRSQIRLTELRTFMIQPIRYRHHLPYRHVVRRHPNLHVLTNLQVLFMLAGASIRHQPMSIGELGAKSSIIYHVNQSCVY